MESKTEDSICVIQESLVKDFAKKCMTSVGAGAKHAEELSNALVMADARDHFSHGINRLDMYVNDIKTGITENSGTPDIIRESAATALVDGKNLLGPVVGNFCMKLAIEKARKAGVGWVCARGSNHYGICGHYALQALEEGFVGYTFTNTTPCLQATRAKKFTLGSNPICCAAPGKNGDSFVLDMATSSVAFGKIEVHHRKGIDIPHNWAADSAGKETTNPSEVLRGGGLLPLGGAEQSSGYKGYGLSMMIEMMCGVMAGATYGPHLRKWGSTDRVADLGQCFIAVDPSSFCGGFESRLQDLMDIHRNLDPVNPDIPVQVPGDPEREHTKKCAELGGIPYPRNIINHINKLGLQLGVGVLHKD